MIAETARLCVRCYTMDDVDALYAILSDAETMAFWPRPFTREETAAWIERGLRNYAEHGFGRYAVIRKEDGALIGDCGLLRLMLDGVERNDLGYIIRRQDWGKGYATEAARAVLEYALGTLGLREVYANMPHDHHASRRVAEKLGMERVGEFHNERNRGILTLLYVARRD